MEQEEGPPDTASRTCNIRGETHKERKKGRKSTPTTVDTEAEQSLLSESETVSTKSEFTFSPGKMILFLPNMARNL